MKNSPILITGSHRSGTTFTGTILSLDKNLGYIHEPFNQLKFNGIDRFETHEWFQYINNSNSNGYYPNFRKTLNYDFSVDFNELKKKPVVNTLHLVKAYIKALENKCLQKRPLVKDPIALFSAPWLSQNFNMDVVVLIRHPAAFVSSVMAFNWSHDFYSFINQPLLMNSHYLEPFRKEVKEFASKDHPIIEQAALLWRIFYSTVRHFQEEFPDWIYLKHETLSQDPIPEFRKLFDRLNLNYTRDIEEQIIYYTCVKNFVDPAPSKPLIIKRDSKKNIFLWKSRLSKEEILFVKDKVSDVSKYFYSEDDW